MLHQHQYPGSTVMKQMMGGCRSGARSPCRPQPSPGWTTHAAALRLTASLLSYKQPGCACHSLLARM